MFTIEMLPAAHGDCLWIEYGDQRRPNVVLIDGGPSSSVTAQRLRGRISERLGPSGAADCAELLVVTHIDADHITGVLRLLTERDGPTPAFADVWFNGWDHLPADVLGAKQGEALSAAILQRRLPWNAALDGAAVMVAEGAPLPVVTLPGGLALTLLSPTRTQLAELRPVWEQELRAAGLVPGQQPVPPPPEPGDVLGDGGDGPVDPEQLAEEPFESDHSEANGASIAFLAEYDGRSVLFTGDAAAPVLEAGLRRLAHERGLERVPVDAFKLPHHGSRYNLSAGLLDLVDCARFLLSTNGQRFHHPDAVALSRIVAGDAGRGGELLFNYRTQDNELWEHRSLRRRYGYTTRYPPDGEEGLVVAL